MAELTFEISVLRAAAALQAGRPVVLKDDTQVRATGALVLPAEAITPEGINLLATDARGIVSVVVPTARVRQLGLSPQEERVVAGPTAPSSFQVASVEARHGVSTGISVADRALTVRVIVDAASGPEALVCPGHVFIHAVQPGGVLSRRGLVEGVFDLARVSGSPSSSAAFSRVLNDDGDESDGPELHSLGVRLDAPVVSVTELVRYRTMRETLVNCTDRATLPTRWGQFDVSVWEETMTSNTHLLFSIGGPAADKTAPLVRVHSQCLTGDAFHSHRCDCGYQLDWAMRTIAEAGKGALLYLRQEGRGIGLAAKLRAYALQDRGRDTVEANLELGYGDDERDYGVGSRILLEAGYHRVILMTNNPRKVQGISTFGVEVVERRPAEIPALAENYRYLKSKKEKLGHLLDGV
ncbi:MAG: GTP cyclohydrolase II [Myxococcales bacterium]|nr:GTP cyclohydrolase II [Myxococcales bacterium]